MSDDEEILETTTEEAPEAPPEQAPEPTPEPAPVEVPSWILEAYEEENKAPEAPPPPPAYTPPQPPPVDPWAIDSDAFLQAPGNVLREKITPVAQAVLDLNSRLQQMEQASRQSQTQMTQREIDASKEAMASMYNNLAKDPAFTNPSVRTELDKALKDYHQTAMKRAQAGDFTMLQGERDPRFAGAAMELAKFFSNYKPGGSPVASPRMETSQPDEEIDVEIPDEYKEVIKAQNWSSDRIAKLKRGLKEREKMPW